VPAARRVGFRLALDEQVEYAVLVSWVVN